MMLLEKLSVRSCQFLLACIIDFLALLLSSYSFERSRVPLCCNGATSSAGDFSLVFTLDLYVDQHLIDC